MARTKKPLVSIGQILQKALKHIAVTSAQNESTLYAKKSTAFDKVKEYSIYLLWQDAVGANIAKHAAPKYFNQGVLTIEVDSSTWMTELKFMKKDLMKNLNEKLGVKKVKDIAFKIR